MQGIVFVLLFTALTFLSWGAYGPLLRHGTDAMGHDGLRAFVGVGLAYFGIAVIVPFSILKKSGEKGQWTFLGTTYSIVAGAVGALGALGIILALVYKGSPVYVMPVVFGFAPIVNTLVTSWMGKTFKQIKPIFIAGIVTAALGAVGVLVFKPQGAPAKAVAVASSEKSADSATADEKKDAHSEKSEEAKSETGETEKSKEQAAPSSESVSAGHASDSKGTNAKEGTNYLMVFLSIAMAALCWGAYGPMLHQGQMRMGGSRLRPFACVGIAYFIIAVAAPLAILATRSGTGSWTASGLSWSIIAGTAGALGALGIILAFNAGGKPIYVMPLVFGFAPVINTFISLAEAGTLSQTSITFWISLAVVIAGAVTVLTNAPKAHHGPAHPPAADPAPAAPAN
ncbi:MAG: hypothetical protein U0892_15060 [Pirellulales bacterium]